MLFLRMSGVIIHLETEPVVKSTGFPGTQAI